MNINNLLYGQITGCQCMQSGIFLTSFPDCNDDPYLLVFEDNFNGNSLDLNKWEIQPWGQGTLSGGATQEYNSLDNAIVSNGILHITAKQETVQRRAIGYLPDTQILSDGLPNLRTYNYTSSNI